MNRAEIQAKTALAGLLLIALILITGAAMYGMLAWWAGGLAAIAMSLVAGLTVWGLVLARQQAVLVDDAALSAGAGVTPVEKNSLGGFRMSYGDDSPAMKPQESASDAKALDIGFQRVVVSIAAVCFIIAAAILFWWLYEDLRAVLPGKPIAVSRVGLDNLALLIGLAGPALFFALYWITRVTRATLGLGEAINGIFSMGLPGMAAIAIATLCAFFKVTYASEIATALVAFLLVLQAMELLVNATRSYAGIEEFDQDPVDLGALPLVPMVTSNWIVGLRMLLAQSVGLASTRADEPGVIARMMPRVLIAALLLLIGVNCFGVVSPGDVAIRERLGRATDNDIDHPLAPGLHCKFPWPIDELVRIPVQAVRYAPVGAEEQLMTASNKPIDFQFWTIRHSGKDEEPDFVTGDSPYQLLGGFVGVWWRVNDPGKFYRNLSHSDFLDTSHAGESEDTERPIYEILVRSVSAEAVTRSFAVHTADEILNTQRAAVEEDCMKRAQKELDALNSGIEIVNLTIKDVHPPIGVGRQQLAGSITYGPADAYELMIENREVKQTMIAMAQTEAHFRIADAQSQAAQLLSDAQQYAIDRVTTAGVDKDRLWALLPQFAPDRQRTTRLWLLYRTLDEVMPDATKIILGKDVLPPDIWQRGAEGSTQLSPLRPPGG